MQMRTRTIENTTRATLAALAMLGALAGCDTIVSDLLTTPTLYINEFMAQNDATLADPDGNGGYPDWIEIYNAGSSSVDLSGMYLTDDLENPTKWRIPDGVAIAAGGHLLFWADKDSDQGDTHTSFALSSTGEELGLFDTADNDYALIDSVVFGPQASDTSYGRSPDGADTWRTFAAATPGQANE